MAKHVLIIDDEQAFLDLMKVALEHHGYSVITATNGEAGLHALKDLHPDIILCDVMMPILNGVSFAQRIQADSRLASIPVIFFSSRPESQVKDLITYAAFLQRPFDIDTLLKLIELYTARPAQ